MKRFNEYVNENNSDKLQKQSYDEFIKEIENDMITDFKMTKEQIEVFIKQYNIILRKCWELGYTPRESIVSTKRNDDLIR